jgi:hypothetical protein
MKKCFCYVLVLVAIFVMLPSTASAAMITLVSATGTFTSEDQVFRQSFAYDPSMGPLQIQTYGYGGSSNAPGGTNAAGTVIVPGGFDPIVGLFAGGIGGGGARIGFDDDGICGPGRGTPGPNCFDSSLDFAVLAAGTYTLSLTVFNNFPPATENGAFPGAVSFNNRAPNFAVDVTAGTAAVPEPATLTLFGTGVAALVARRRKSRNLR